MSKKNENVAEWMYDVVRRPVITEKAMTASEHGKIVFNVPVSSTKTEIKKAVEALFGVNVISVNTLRQDGKTKRFKGIKGKRNETKKAYVSLAEGQSIDITSGVN
ncbi:MAG: 50S ribosomal protein L23 [Alphaproteobacteria bacterium]|nr:50S ribosomal protein L23 [Alphaproteobacteria bacterium]